MSLAPGQRRILETLARIHARAAKALAGRASVPPPLPPELPYDGRVDAELITLQGSELSDQAISVLASPDPGGQADPDARQPLPLFAELELEPFQGLVERMDYRELKEGDVICRQGEDGHRIFVLVAGKAEVTRLVDGQPRPLAFLGGGAIFGEISLMTGAPPTSTVTAATDCEVLTIEREHLNALARTFPSVPQVLASFAQQRMARNLVATSPVFGPVPEPERVALLSRFAFRALVPGERVISEGEPVQALVLVLAGELVVQKDDPAGGVVSLSILREGDVAGEIALLKGLRATATVAASRKTAVATLARAPFEALLTQYPALRDYLEGLSERRLRQIGEALRPAEVLDADELVLEGGGA
jgi:CRP-like cAMP-binding protein